jgi:hypothetical protein
MVHTVAFWVDAVQSGWWVPTFRMNRGPRPEDGGSVNHTVP